MRTRSERSQSLSKILVEAVIPFLALTLAACGQSGTPETPPPSSTQPAAASQTPSDAPRLETDGTEATDHAPLFDIGEATLGFTQTDKDRTIGDRSIFIT